MMLPFDPLRDALYSRQELFAGFSSKDADSYARCPDMAAMSYFVRYGKNPARDNRVSTLEALHDNSISMAATVFRERFPKVVAVMGGHGMKRAQATSPFGDVATIAYRLAHAGFLLVSGGGPGAMEATHVGAAFSGKPPDALDAALRHLAQHVDLPADLEKLVAPDGTIDGAKARELHAWFAPAMELAEELGKDIRPSLGVPTWLYGHEPTTPFATHSAKYFQNSIREDGLVTLGVQGMIYAEGSAGTIQEIFQDAAQNYYGAFSPMVFLSGKASPGEHYWEKKLPVRPLVEALLGKRPGFPEKVLFTDSVDDTVAFLMA
jgi:predicted Rossmann-fold nucleotide-binding protein